MAKDEEPIELRCPECGEVFRVEVEEAERESSARCPKGHDVPIAKAI
jgi:predicted RNA-binding Zn-ribbon protein involved in translation (DUF1610 family)